MKRQLPIPIDEQIKAAALDVSAVYSLIGQFVEKTQLFNLRIYITIERHQLVLYFKEHPELAERHLLKSIAENPYHDMPILESSNGKYKVAWKHRGEDKDVKYFDNLFNAAAEYVFYSL